MLERAEGRFGGGDRTKLPASVTGMRRQNGVTKEALSRLPEFDVCQLREMWCRLCKTEAAEFFHH
jgi:hypothetical protein